MKNVKLRRLTRNLPGKLFLLVATLITVLPLLWMLKTAFSDNHDLVTGAGSLLPEEFTIVNFKRILGFATEEEILASGGKVGVEINFLLYLWNTTLFAGITAIAQTLFCTTAGYLFARVHFRGRTALFNAMLIGMFVPGIMLTIPNFILVKDLGWINTFPGLIAPFLLMSPFAIFFMRQFFLSFPSQVEEAAKLDGLNVWGRFWRIVLPMSLPPMITLVVIVAVSNWQEYLWPLIVSKDPASRTISAGLSALSDSSRGSFIDWGGLMAASTVSILPIVLLLLIVGRRLVDSIQLSGLR